MFTVIFTQAALIKQRPTRKYFLPIFERYGYRTVLKEPKFGDPVVQEWGLMPTWYHLLELRT